MVYTIHACTSEHENMAVDDIQSEQQKEINMLSSLTQLTGDELMDLRLPDYKRLQDAVQDFFG